MLYLFLYQYNKMNCSSPHPNKKLPLIFRTPGRIGFFGTSQGFGSILEQNLAKTMKGPRKTMVLVPKRWRVPTNQKNKVLEHWVIWQLKTPKLCFFWFFGTLQRFGKALLQNAPKTLRGAKNGFGKALFQNAPKTLRGPKKTTVLVPKRLRVPKKPKKQSFGALSCQITQCSKTLFFFFVFWCPPAFWHQDRGFSGTLHGFGKVSLQNALKTLKGTKKNKVLVPKRWRVPTKTKNKKQSFGVLSCQITPCSKTLFFFVFFGTLQRFGTKTLVCLGPSTGLAKFSSKMQLKSRFGQHCGSETTVSWGFMRAPTWFRPGIRFRI